MQDRSAVPAPPAPMFYRGWLVVAAAFLVAMFGFGSGFYGPGVYLVALEARNGWPVGEISAAITAYYVLGAVLLLLVVGPLFEKWGARTVVTIGAVAMAGGMLLLTLVARPWQVYAGFSMMSLGWATMSGAAINIIVAPWFETRRGLALSLALNGGSAGGVVIAPLLISLISNFGFSIGLAVMAGSMLAILVPVVVVVLRPKRKDEHDPADYRSAPRASDPRAPEEIDAFRLRNVLRSRAFLTISIPFALGLTAQVGFLTHQVALLSPVIGTIAAGWAVSMTTAAAVAGRIATGFVIDRFDRRVAASLNFAVQVLGIWVLAGTTEPLMLYLGCVLFGVGVGNATSLPGLIVQREFATPHFARTVSLVVAVNQSAFAFGPILFGSLRQARGSYTAPLMLALAMQIVAAIVVLTPVITMAISRRAGAPDRASPGRETSRRSGS